MPGWQRPGILTPAGEVTGVAEAGPDAVLFGLLAELEAARDKARPDAPCGAEALPPAPMRALAEFLRIEGAVIGDARHHGPGHRGESTGCGAERRGGDDESDAIGDPRSAARRGGVTW